MKKPLGRKLLVASVGVAAVAFSACSNQVVGNLMAGEAGPPPDSGNDAAQSQDASADGSMDAAGDASSGDASSSDASDAGAD